MKIIKLKEKLKAKKTLYMLYSIDFTLKFHFP